MSYKVKLIEMKVEYFNAEAGDWSGGECWDNFYYESPTFEDLKLENVVAMLNTSLSFEMESRFEFKVEDLILTEGTMGMARRLEDDQSNYDSSGNCRTSYYFEVKKVLLLPSINLEELAKEKQATA